MSDAKLEKGQALLSELAACGRHWETLSVDERQMWVGRLMGSVDEGGAELRESGLLDGEMNGVIYAIVGAALLAWVDSKESE